MNEGSLSEFRLLLCCCSVFRVCVFEKLTWYRYLFVILSIDLLPYPRDEAGSLCSRLLCIFIASVPKLWVLKKNFSKDRYGKGHPLRCSLTHSCKEGMHRLSWAEQRLWKDMLMRRGRQRTDCSQLKNCMNVKQRI